MAKYLVQPRCIYIVLFVIFAVNLTVSKSYAGFSCSGPLTNAQIEGFKTFFDPDFTPALSHTGGAVSAANMAKVLNSSEFDLLSTDTPIIAAQVTLDSNNASHLKNYLNSNATAEVPGFIATALAIFVPSSWIGLAADAATQVINQTGTAGRIKLANIAGTVSAGGVAGVIHQIVSNDDGAYFYIWNYVYTADLNGEKVQFHLESCAADVVVH